MIKPKTKSFLIIFITLIIGMAIGFEISEILIQKRFDEFKAARKPKSFVNLFEQILQPGEKQKEAIEPILLKYQKKVDGIISGGREQVDIQIDSLAGELKPFLTNEQMNNFITETQKMKKGPPPH